MWKIHYTPSMHEPDPMGELLINKEVWDGLPGDLQALLHTLLRSWDKIAAEEAAKGPFFKKVMESQRAYASLIVPCRLSTWPPCGFAGNYCWQDAVFGKTPE